MLPFLGATAEEAWAAGAVVVALGIPLITLSYRAGKATQKLDNLTKTVGQLVDTLRKIWEQAILHPAHPECPLLLLQEREGTNK